MESVCKAFAFSHKCLTWLQIEWLLFFCATFLVLDKGRRPKNTMGELSLLWGKLSFVTASPQMNVTSVEDQILVTLLGFSLSAGLDSFLCTCENARRSLSLVFGHLGEFLTA